MKKFTLIAIMSALLMTNAYADSIKIGILVGFTGPIESLTPAIAQGAELAMQEASESGNLLGGRTVESVRGDSTCTDAAAATAAAERLITSDKVVAIMGADCSGVTMAVANNVGIPNGVVLISPSATSPALSTLDDNGYFFRVAPSDARQGQVLADILKRRGVTNVAITYTNNDYGKGLADSFGAAFQAIGGTIGMTAAHEDGKADYTAEVGALSATGAEHLVVFGYVDQGGKGILQAALDTGAFSSFFGADGMSGMSLIENLGDSIEGFVTTVPGSDSAGATNFQDIAMAAGLDGSGPFVGEAYDAAALIILAIQAAGSVDRAAIQSKVMDVANAPGEMIMPGELAKALQILADGGDVDYVGASNVELNDIGETFGSYKEQVIENGKYTVVQYH